MYRLRRQLSALLIWGMIPLAAFAGLPSTGCLCVNGQFKFFCGHSYQVAAENSAKHSGCCADEHAATADCDGCVAAASEPRGDCCQHGEGLAGNGVDSRTCCQRVVNAPSMSPAKVKALSDDSLALAVCEIELTATNYPAIVAEAVEFDTGPPLDRVVVFRHLLI